MRYFNLIPAIAILSIGFSGATDAQSFNPTAPALNFNAFTAKAVTFTGGDTHGPVATGGDAILAGSTIVSMNTSGTYPTNTLNSTGNYCLVIGGRVWYNSGNQTQLSRGQLKLGSTSGSTVSYINGNATEGHAKLTSTSSSSAEIYANDAQPAGSVTTAHGLDFTTAFNTMKYYSSVMNSYGAMSSAQQSAAGINVFSLPSGTGGTQTISITSGKVNYISMSTATLHSMYSSGATYVFSTAPTAGTIVIFNITNTGSGTFDWYPANFGGSPVSYSPYIIWNFSGTQRINIAGSNSSYGTLYAPQATIVKTAGNNTEGQVVADSLTIVTGEIHYQPFAGTLPPPSVPLPIAYLNGLEAKSVDEGIALSWNVAGLKMRELTLQRSADGHQFSDLAVVSGDAYLDLTSAGTAYYRLRGIMADGSVSYSNTAVATQYLRFTEANAAPNPFRNTIRVSSSAFANAAINWQIVDVTGRSVVTGAAAGNAEGAMRIDGLENLPFGFYMLRASVNGYSVSVKLQKAE